MKFIIIVLLSICAVSSYASDRKAGNFINDIKPCKIKRPYLGSFECNAGFILSENDTIIMNNLTSDNIDWYTSHCHLEPIDAVSSKIVCSKSKGDVFAYISDDLKYFNKINHKSINANTRDMGDTAFQTFPNGQLSILQNQSIFFKTKSVANIEYPDFVVVNKNSGEIVLRNKIVNNSITLDTNLIPFEIGGEYIYGFENYLDNYNLLLPVDDETETRIAQDIKAIDNSSTPESDKVKLKILYFETISVENDSIDFLWLIEQAYKLPN